MKIVEEIAAGRHDIDSIDLKLSDDVVKNLV